MTTPNKTEKKDEKRDKPETSEITLNMMILMINK